MRVAEAGLGGETIYSGTAVAKRFFDGPAESKADAIEVTRDAGFMFGELAANFGEGLLLRIVEAQALFIARVEVRKSGLQGTNEKRDVALAMRVGGLYGNGVRNLGGARLGIVVVEGFEAASSADGVNVALSEDGAEPGLERTATVEIAEERALAAGSIGESVEFGKERIGKIAGFWGSGTATENGGCGSSKIGAEGADEMVPRRFAIFHAGGGEGQVFKVQCDQVFVQHFRREVSAGKALFCAAFERSGKPLAGKPPAAGFGLSIEPLDFGGGRGGRLCGPGALGRVACL